jgi:hypothetical protein
VRKNEFYEFEFLFFGFGGGNLTEENKKGDFTIWQKKKNSEFIEEEGHIVEVPSDVSKEKKKALEQTGDDATSGW